MAEYFAIFALAAVFLVIGLLCGLHLKKIGQ